MLLEEFLLVQGKGIIAWSLEEICSLSKSSTSVLGIKEEAAKLALQKKESPEPKDWCMKISRKVAFMSMRSWGNSKVAEYKLLFLVSSPAVGFWAVSG